MVCVIYFYSLIIYLLKISLNNVNFRVFSFQYYDIRILHFMIQKAVGYFKITKEIVILFKLINRLQRVLNLRYILPKVCF